MSFTLLCCFLLVGHGNSSGERVCVDDFQIYVRDVIQHIEIIKQKHTNIPLFLFGHSMVGKIYQQLIYSMSLSHLEWYYSRTACYTKARIA